MDEVGPNVSPIRNYLWGDDLSGTSQGAGGVGGLLEVCYHGASATNCFATYDGNGNLMTLVNAADGTLIAEYDYGPFGELIRSTGPMAEPNPLRYSSKYQDDETTLIYYGYRHYAASSGRWMSRDPFEELGGGNIYSFIANTAPNGVDWFGLCTIHKKKDPSYELTITPQGINPQSIEGMSELIGAAESVEVMEKVLIVVDTVGTGAAVGGSEAVTTSVDRIIDSQTKPDAAQLVKKVIGLLPAAGRSYGYQAYTRIKFQECECGGIGHLFFNYWDDQQTDWKLYNGPSDLGLGTFDSRLGAIKAGVSQGKKELRAWKEANKRVFGNSM